MRRRPSIALAVAVAAATVASASGVVFGGSSDAPEGPVAVPTTTAPVTAGPVTTAPAATAPAPSAGPTVPPSTAGLPTAAPTTTPPQTGIDIATVVDVGEAKQPRIYDSYLAASLQDIQNWWRTEFPRLYGSPYTELAGGIFAGYPERVSPIPPCGGGSEQTTYQEVADFGAFYCSRGDFMAYDDGEQGVLYQLAEAYGPSVLAVVLAHEFGHAIQYRSGVLDQDVETVITEQQADCFAGAWSYRAWRGEVPGLDFTDADVRAGLIALVVVRDPPGYNVFEPGGHGSAFDRIGAFQQGFIGGVDACVRLIDEPLPLLAGEFTTDDDAANQGNAPFGYGDNQIMGIVQSDLIDFWPAEVAQFGREMPLIQLRPVTDPASDNCNDPFALAESGAVFCTATSEVLFHEARARELYDRFGDFAAGYAIGHAWADGVQAALGYTLEGEDRSLISDCMVGAWVAGALTPPDNFAGTTTTSPVHLQRTMSVSPGDLDEAVQTAIVIGDPGFQDDLKGSAFERIAFMRIGVLEGFAGCVNQANIRAAG